MRWLDEILDPDGLVSGRLTGLLGVLWLSGGAIVLASMLGGTYASGRPERVAALGVFAVALGAILLAATRRTLALWHYVALTLLGAAVIALIELWSGPEVAAVPGVLYVYVAWFAIITVRRWALLVLAASAGMHLAALVATAASGGVGSWVLVWGVAVVAGWLAGGVVEANRQAAAVEQRLADQLRAADAVKTTFLRAIGHELTGPMTAIMGLAETLVLRGEELDDASRREMAGRIAAGTGQLHETLTGLVDLGRVGPGEVRIDVEAVRVSDVVARAVALTDVDPARVRVECDRSIEVRADDGKLAHAVANLIINADKYGGGGPIDVLADQRGGMAVVCVEDRGPGIADPVKDRVFEPFERGRQEDVTSGSGIGLSLVREFVHLHGGEAWVEDRDGGGARVCISVPLVAVDTAGGDGG